MKGLKIILALIIVNLICNFTFTSYAAGDPVTYWDTELDRMQDEEELLSDIRVFGIDQMSRLIFKVGDIDRFIFINGNIDFNQIWNIDLIYLINPTYYGYEDYLSQKEKEASQWNDYLEYEIYWASASIEALNGCMNDLNLFIYSLGKSGYYKYNYLWKDLNVEIDKINHKIEKYNKNYGYSYNTLPKVEGLYSKWYKYYEDEHLKDAWKSIEDTYQGYYDDPIYPQTIKEE